MSDDKTLVIWLENGNTCLFEKIDKVDLNRDKKELSFHYFGVSTQVRRVATFNLEKIAGYAIEV